MNSQDRDSFASRRTPNSVQPVPERSHLAGRMPVTARRRLVQRDYHDVAGANTYLLVAAWADVLLARLVRLHALQFGGPASQRVLDVTGRRTGLSTPSPVRGHGLNYVARVDSLLTDRSNGVLTVTLNRPERKNAVNTELWKGLLEVFRDAAHSEEDRVVVVTGAGGEFCAGADLGVPEAGSSHPLVRMRMIHDVALALHRLPQPTIAKVDGVAVGAGCNLALGCDLVVASERARFSEIFAKRGLSLDFGGSWLLPRRIGLHRAKELAFFGDIIDAAEAERIGLVNRVVPVGELDDFVGGWASRLAAGPPLALAVSKALLDDSAEMSLPEALDREGAAQAMNSMSEDGREALGAFLERREPNFRGC